MIIPSIVFLVALLMIFYEVRRKGRVWPQVRGWWLRALLLNGAQVGTVYLAGLTWDRWLLGCQPWSLHTLGDSSGALLGYLVITFFFYWWHRWRHKSDFLWRWLHQVHHSPKRLEILTAFYKHPFELVADSVLCSLILYPLLGLNPVAASYAVLLSALAELFYHWNVSTPHWVGYIFQRPESHCIHHEYGVHAYNYADLPLWDMIFGTFRNPKEWKGECGLGEEGEHRIQEMLLGVDISRTKNCSTKKRLFALCTPLFLIGVGLLQMIGDVANVGALKGLGMAVNASPAPKVFCTADSLETFSSRFQLEWKDSAGVHHSLLLTPENASTMKGPYNRRNVYGAILSYGPVLDANPHMKQLYEAVLAHGTQGEAPLLTEMGIDREQIDGSLWISVHPRADCDVSHLNLKKEVSVR